MRLIRWQNNTAPFGMLRSLQSDLSQLFDVFEPPVPERWGLSTGAFVPPMDLYDQTDKFVARMDLPGVEKDKVEVTVVGDTLTIRGEKTSQKTQGCQHTERAFGTFSRSLALPAAVDAEKVTAALRDGVLEVVLPKSERSRPRQVSVKA